MSQNHEHLSWTFDEVDGKLHSIMDSIYAAASSAARSTATVTWCLAPTSPAS